MPNVDQQATTKSEPQMDGQVIFHGQSMMTTFANQNFQATRSATQNRKKLATQVADAGEIGLLGQKRAVGRPRKAAECETAADRRRTQIRLAQRAFRDRKESTITGLRERVEELEKANADMSRLFYRYHQLALSQGFLDTAAADNAQFMAITDDLLRLCAEQGEETGRSSSDDNRLTPSGSVKSHTVAGSITSAGRCSACNALLRNSTPDIERNSSPVPAPTAYQVITQATSNNASFPIHPTMHGAPTPVTFVSMDSHYTTATVPLDGSIANPQLSFSQRLHRRMTEHGLLLASTPNLPPEKYDDYFGFSLMLDSRDSIARHLSRQLTDLVTPFEDQASRENGLQDEHMGQQIGMIFTGDKEILDADEIDVYLRQCGILIPQQVDYVDANVDVNSLSDSPVTLNGNAAMSTNSSGYNNPNYVTQIEIDRTPSPNNSAMQRVQISAAGSVAAGGGLMPYMGSTEMGNMRHSAWTTSKITINVGLLVEELAARSVYTGKQPGVHIKDINLAIKVAAGLF